MSAAERLREQGRQQVRAEGVAKGEAMGRVAVLLNQLTLKFGAVTPSLRKRLMSASVAELDALAARVVIAKTVRDVFGSAPAPRARSVRRRKSSSDARKRRP